MKLSEYINKLHDFLDEHGDMECYYSSDDEGNEYQEVYYGGTLFLMREDQQNEYHPELIGCDDEDHIKELKEDDCGLVEVCVIN